jgi:hypothetical protein
MTILRVLPSIPLPIVNPLRHSQNWLLELHKTVMEMLGRLVSGSKYLNDNPEQFLLDSGVSMPVISLLQPWAGNSLTERASKVSMPSDGMLRLPFRLTAFDSSQDRHSWRPTLRINPMTISV